MLSSSSDKRLENLLNTWERSYKKGQLTFFILLSLKKDLHYQEEIRNFIIDISAGQMNYDKMSIYRALRKLEDQGIIGFKQGTKGNDAKRKYYYLTDFGARLLYRFINRNIELYYSPSFRALVNC